MGRRRPVFKPPKRPGLVSAWGRFGSTAVWACACLFGMAGEGEKQGKAENERKCSHRSSTLWCTTDKACLSFRQARPFPCLFSARRGMDLLHRGKIAGPQNPVFLPHERAQFSRSAQE